MAATIEKTRGEWEFRLYVLVRKTRTDLQGAGRVLERFERLVLTRELNAYRFEQAGLFAFIVRGGQFRTQFLDGFHMITAFCIVKYLSLKANRKSREVGE